MKFSSKSKRMWSREDAHEVYARATRQERELLKAAQAAAASRLKEELGWDSAGSVSFDGRRLGEGATLLRCLAAFGHDWGAIEALIKAMAQAKRDCDAWLTKRGVRVGRT